MRKKDEYILRYLPLFYDDLEQKALYIKEKLLNEKAAEDLIDDVEKAIRQRLSAPESFEPYHSGRNRRYPYYRIHVRNYTVYYVVIKDEGPQKIMEVRRLLYNGQNRNALI